MEAPWHSNADALFQDTGCDVRDKYLTQGICALKRTSQAYKPDLYEDVLHYDEKAVIGKYERVNEIAQELSNKLGKKVYYAVISASGGESYLKEPIISKE